MRRGIQALIPLAMVAIVLGAAFAMWSEVLKVNVTVNTGEVDVAFAKWWCSDKGPDPQARGFHNEEGKNVANCSVTVEKVDTEHDVIKLKVTINNAYPGYTTDISMVIKNVGTVPVKLAGYSISSYDQNALRVSLSIPSDTQIDPGDNSTYVLHITVLQGAEENAQYSFEVTLTFAQWNEVSGPE